MVGRTYCQFPEPLLDVVGDAVAFLVCNLDKFPVDLGDYFKNGGCNVQRVICLGWSESCAEDRERRKSYLRRLGLLSLRQNLGLPSPVASAIRPWRWRPRSSH